MLISRLVAMTLMAGAAALDAGVVCSQEFPYKPIRMVTAGVGGSTDFVTRLIAQEISGPLGQQVIVDNRPSGVIQAELVSRALPDGYTVLVTGSAFWISPLLQNTTYDPVRDFLPVTLAERGVNVLAVHPSLPVKSVKDLIAMAKARPGELNYASTAAGGGNHLAAELFKAMAGVSITRVPYKSGGDAINAVMGNEVQMMFASTASAAPHVKSGRLRSVAVTSAQPSALAPGLPTVAATGVPGYEAVTITGIFAPARTPATAIGRLNQEIVRALSRGDMKEKFFSAGSEAVGSSPEELAAAIKSDLARMGKVIKDAGIRSE